MAATTGRNKPAALGRDLRQAVDEVLQGVRSTPLPPGLAPGPMELYTSNTECVMDPALWSDNRPHAVAPSVIACNISMHACF